MSVKFHSELTFCPLLGWRAASSKNAQVRVPGQRSGETGSGEAEIDARQGASGPGKCGGAIVTDASTDAVENGGKTAEDLPDRESAFPQRTCKEPDRSEALRPGVQGEGIMPKISDALPHGHSSGPYRNDAAGSSHSFRSAWGAAFSCGNMHLTGRKCILSSERLKNVRRQVEWPYRQE